MDLAFGGGDASIDLQDDKVFLLLHYYKFLCLKKKTIIIITYQEMISLKHFAKCRVKRPIFKQRILYEDQIGGFFFRT